jgi:transposase
MTSPPDLIDKDALIAILVSRLEEREATIVKLAARVAELEGRLNRPRKGPGNSSVPPSQGHKPSGSGGSKGKGKPHRGAHRALHPDPTRKLTVAATMCGCGAVVSGVAQSGRHTYDCVEIPPIEPDVTQVTLQGGVCPCCGKRFKAEAPEGLEPGSPFGPNLCALVIYLRSVQAIPLARLADVLFDLLGLRISEGAIVNILEASQDAFAAQTSRFKRDLMAGTVIASDETGMRVGKTNRWLWVFHHGLTAVFLGNQSRAKTVVEGFLGDWRPNYWLSDRYGGQVGWAVKEQQYCLAHLIRDVQYAIDNGDMVLAPRLRRLLAEACAIGRRRDKLSDATLEAHERKLDHRLDQIMALIPSAPAGVELHRVFRKIRAHLFVFVTNREVSPTNNGSERAVRPCTIYRKVTNGFRAEWAAELYADVRGVVETGRRRSLRAIDAIRLTLAGEPIPLPA